MDMMEIGAKLAVNFVPFLFALCFHEYAHGLVAKWRGDNTAEQMGRLTMNPMAHADMVGTFILPILGIVTGIPILFGWAKPVPVNSRNLKNVRTDMFWIALAGPLSNIILAVATTFFMMITVRYDMLGTFSKPILTIAQSFILINLILALFNMIPLHPLDGGKVLARFLPASINYKLEQNEHISGYILLALMLTGAFSILSKPVYFIFSSLMALAQAGAVS